jgi:hypothetical protein
VLKIRRSLLPCNGRTRRVLREVHSDPLALGSPSTCVVRGGRELELHAASSAIFEVNAAVWSIEN